MRNLYVFIILILLLACLKADNEKTLDMIKLKNGSVLLGHITLKDSVKYVIRIYGTDITINRDSVFSEIEDLPDPNQFSFPNVLPEENVKKWYVPVYWLKEQLFHHEVRGMETFEIAVDLESQKLYLKGFGHPTTMVPDTAMMMFKTQQFVPGYFEKIPPDNGD